MKEEHLLLLSDSQKLIKQVVLIDYTIIILGDEKMEWMHQLNQAIAYIEDHLTEEIDYRQLGKIACCSEIGRAHV